MISQSSLNSLTAVLSERQSPYSNYERREDNCMAIVGHNEKLTQGNGFRLTFFYPTLLALTPTEKYSYVTKLKEGYK